MRRQNLWPLQIISVLDFLLSNYNRLCQTLCLASHVQWEGGEPSSIARSSSSGSFAHSGPVPSQHSQELTLCSGPENLLLPVVHSSSATGKETNTQSSELQVQAELANRTDT